MNKFLLDDELLSKLDNLSNRTEFCDSAGRTLGIFVPAADDDWLYTWAAAQITDEELLRRSEEPGGMTTPQVQDYLRTL